MCKYGSIDDNFDEPLNTLTYSIVTLSNPFTVLHATKGFNFYL